MSERSRGDPLTLSRWSRLKREAGTDATAPQRATPADPGVPAARASEAAPPFPENAPQTGARAADTRTPSPEGGAATRPPLPPVDSLTFDADFGAFLRPEVDESLKRAALKKLFADPRFNVMDGLDVYIDDYSKPDPLPPGMLEQLVSAKHALRTPAQPPGAETPGPAPGIHPDHDAQRTPIAPAPADVDRAGPAATPGAAAMSGAAAAPDAGPDEGDAVPAGPTAPGRDAP